MEPIEDIPQPMIPPPMDVFMDLGRLLQCGRCKSRDLAVELRFSCRHRFCGTCIRDMLVDGRIKCEQCLCRRCKENTVGIELSFSCKHKYCAVCMVAMLDEVTGEINCDICAHPENYPAVHIDDMADFAPMPSSAQDLSLSESRQTPYSDSISGSGSSTPHQLVNIQRENQIELQIPNENVTLEVMQFRYANRVRNQTILNKQIANMNIRDVFVAVNPVSNHIYVSDSRNHKIHRLSSTGEYMHCYGGIGQGCFCHPRGIAITEGGRILVADTNNNRVQVLNEGCESISMFGSRGTDDDKFWALTGVAFHNDLVYTTDYKRIKVFTISGQPVRSFTHPEARRFWEISVNQNGIYVSDAGGSVLKFALDGTFLKKIGDRNLNELYNAFGICLDSNGFLLVADSNNRLEDDVRIDRIQVFSPNDELFCTVDVAENEKPWDLASKEDGTLVVSSMFRANRWQAGEGIVAFY